MTKLKKIQEAIISLGAARAEAAIAEEGLEQIKKFADQIGKNDQAMIDLCNRFKV